MGEGRFIRNVSTKRFGVLARPEPFRGLLDKAFQADLAPSGSPLGPGIPAALRRPPVLAVVAPPPVLDDEHKSKTLEQRLDAAVLAGATPPRGQRPPRLPEHEMVPLRLRSPFEIQTGQVQSQRPAPQRPSHQSPAAHSQSQFKSTTTKTASVREISGARRAPPTVASVDVTRPAPRVLQFLPDQPGASPSIHGGSGDFAEQRGVGGDSLNGMPRLEPVHDSQRLPVAVGVHTNVYRLRSDEDEATPARPLPAVSLELMGELETRKLRGRDKVMTRESLNGLGVDVRAFSSDDFAALDDLTHEGSFVDPDTDDRGARAGEGRSAAAVALPALSDEMELDPVDVDFSTFDDLDELAAQLGLHSVLVPRSTSPQAAPAALIDDLDEVEADDVELVAVAAPTASDPFGAVVMGRLAHMPTLAARLDADEDGLLDDDGLLDEDGLLDDDTEVTSPRAIPLSLLPSSLFDGACTPSSTETADLDHPGDDGLDDDDITPARGTLRPAIVAPQAVRFVVADAPARPRHDALSAEEKLRNRTRARELYLVAMDDLGARDPQGAIVHLELAIAYDDETSLYLDLLEQLKKNKRA